MLNIYVFLLALHHSFYKNETQQFLLFTPCTLLLVLAFNSSILFANFVLSSTNNSLFESSPSFHIPLFFASIIILFSSSTFWFSSLRYYTCICSLFIRPPSISYLYNFGTWNSGRFKEQSKSLYIPLKIKSSECLILLHFRDF